MCLCICSATVVQDFATFWVGITSDPVQVVKRSAAGEEFNAPPGSTAGPAATPDRTTKRIVPSTSPMPSTTPVQKVLPPSILRKMKFYGSSRFIRICGEWVGYRTYTDVVLIAFPFTVCEFRSLLVALCFIVWIVTRFELCSDRDTHRIKKRLQSFTALKSEAWPYLSSSFSF